MNLYENRRTRERKRAYSSPGYDWRLVSSDSNSADIADIIVGTVIGNAISDAFSSHNDSGSDFSGGGGDFGGGGSSGDW